MKNFTLKLTFGLSLFLLLETAASAQGFGRMIDENYMRYGIKGGMNLTSLYIDNIDNRDMLRTFHFGGFLRQPIYKDVSVQPEIYFTQKGAEVTYNDDLVQGIVQYRFNYIEIPILLRIRLTEWVEINGGPYFAFMLWGKAENKSNTNPFDFEDRLSSDNYNKLDTGIALGTGLVFDRFGLGVRFNLGLNRVGRERGLNDTTYAFPDGRTGTFSIYASFALN